MREKLKNWKSQEIKLGLWYVLCFQTWSTEKDLAIYFKTMTKIDLSQALCQFYGTMKNVKGEPYGFSSYVGLNAGLNRYIIIHRSVDPDVC